MLQDARVAVPCSLRAAPQTTSCVCRTGSRPQAEAPGQANQALLQRYRCGLVRALSSALEVVKLPRAVLVIVIIPWDPSPSWATRARAGEARKVPSTAAIKIRAPHACVNSLPGTMGAPGHSPARAGRWRPLAVARPRRESEDGTCPGKEREEKKRS